MILFIISNKIEKKRVNLTRFFLISFSLVYVGNQEIVVEAGNNDL